MPLPKRNDKGLDRLVRYLLNPRTIKEIQRNFKVSERCAYRWMQYLKDDGVDVVVRTHPGYKNRFLVI